MKRFGLVLFVAVLSAMLLTACGKKVGYTPPATEAPVDTLQRAQEIALEALNRSLGEVTDMSGEETEEGYEVIIYCEEDKYVFVIDDATGKVLDFKE